MTLLILKGGENVTQAQKRRVRRNILTVIKNHRAISTRDLINYVAAPGLNITRYHINGHLSWLKKTGQIIIVTIRPGCFSIAL